MTSPALHRDQFVATVLENTFLCREHYRLVLRLDSFPPTDPGQFVQVACRSTLPSETDVEHDWTPGERLTFSDPDLLGPMATLRRPFSLAGRRDLPDGAVELHFIQRTVGIGTDYLSRLSAGDEVDVLGPLGNRFILPADRGIALLVGGGVGIPPMIYLASRLEGRKAIAFSGAMTRDLLPLAITDDAPAGSGDPTAPLYNVAEFARHGIPAILSTDDGSFGCRGFVTDALKAYLDRYLTDNADRRLAVIYTCGPEGMMRKVADIAARRQIACQVAVERAMACGMGTCQSCCIRVKKPDRSRPPMVGSDWCYRLACTDGPVFNGTDLLW